MSNEQQYPLIESLQNPRLKTLYRLREKRARLRQSRFLVEGYRELDRALSNNIALANLFICPELWSDAEMAQQLLTTISEKNTPVFRLTPPAFKKVSVRQHPNGLLAECKLNIQTLDDINIQPNMLILVAEAIEKPGNLGALIRSAVAANAHAVVCTNVMTDFHNHNAIRNSQGLLFTLPCVTCSNEELYTFLQQHDTQTIATLPSAEKDYWSIDYQQNTAFIVGNEAQGLSEFWQSKANQQVTIPVNTKAESINVAMAATLCLFEAQRQRKP